ncbi:AAA family ATPase [Actinomadura flavalba]|uniref:AAA family ATPase n=1 Tax=Actinomadura flavalba TaxID=1120938 RepID=UPI000378EEB0|nr:helix-turn-helix transcriptional regulator [Actinomadura flavalba]
MLYGRDEELRRIATLVGDACDHRRSGALVLRGEAGIGKSALLDAAPRPGMRVLRAVGVEAEARITFAGLHQLLWPVRERVAGLPPAQAAALRGALGLTPGDAPERFAVGLALLTLLAELAADEPLLCLVDDAHWLDPATAETLLFAARRLDAEGVVLLVAARDDGFVRTGLPEAAVRRLDDADADRLLAGRGLPHARRPHVLRAAAGNPLALVEFGAAGRALPERPVPLTVPDRVLAGYGDRIEELPERTRWMLLLAAAEGRGHTPTLLAAATALGVGLADLGPAERAGLVTVAGTTLTFRHPLIRAAAYQHASAADRVTAHHALYTTADDASCQLRHHAAATLEPDEPVAARLTAAADSAQARGGHGTAGALLRQAAELTPDAAVRARRLTRAAALRASVGDPDEAADLIARAEHLTRDPADLARLAAIRARLEHERGDTAAAARRLVAHAAHAADADRPRLLRDAALYGWTAGEPDVVAAAARGGDDPLVRGVAHLIAGEYEDAAPPLAVLAAAGRDAAPTSDGRYQAVHAALMIGADEAALDLTADEVAQHRARGLIGALPGALRAHARALLAVGRHADVIEAAQESATLARDTGLPRRDRRLAGTLGRVAAIEGDADRLAALDDVPPGPRALLALGLGRPDETLRLLADLVAGPRRHSPGAVLALADLVEAAVRLGRPVEARPAAARLHRWATATGQPWAQAVAARCAASLTDEEEPFVRALALHERASRPFEHARTALLYGEWLRRHRRRADSRTPLRTALTLFEGLHAVPWADRARDELRATGEPGAVAGPDTDLLDRLTPQERQVVRLAAAGASSREIAAQLFLSPRTVEYHLYKAYPKLGISSRRELAALAS